MLAPVDTVTSPTAPATACLDAERRVLHDGRRGISYNIVSKLWPEMEQGVCKTRTNSTDPANFYGAGVARVYFRITLSFSRKSHFIFSQVS
jgi:hypothetical protein